MRFSETLEDARLVTLIAVGAAAAAAWWASWASMAGMSGMGAGGMGAGGMAMPMGADRTDAPGWSLGLVASTSGMWALMMLAMMLPAMAPAMAIYARLSAQEDRGGRLALRVALFGAGYFALWAGVSVALALAQLVLRDSAYFSMGGTQAGPVAAGALTLAAGLYQFTGVKNACLRHCRHPMTFLIGHWREGLSGAFPMGLRHGVYCVGCCVAFMGLMFVFGAMNLIWMAAIALYFVAEKIAPAAERWSRAVGVLLVVAGAAILVHAAL